MCIYTKLYRTKINKIHIIDYQTFNHQQKRRDNISTNSQRYLDALISEICPYY